MTILVPASLAAMISPQLVASILWEVSSQMDSVAQRATAVERTTSLLSAVSYCSLSLKLPLFGDEEVAYNNF